MSTDTFQNENTIGIVMVSDTVDIYFSIYVNNDKKYGDIRKYVHTKKYSGPTKKGVRLLGKYFKEILEICNQQTITPTSLPRELGQISISKNHKLILSIIELSDIKYLLLSNYFSSKHANGHGVAIKLDIYEKFIKMLSSLVYKLDYNQNINDSQMTNNEISDFIESFIRNPKAYAKDTNDILKIRDIINKSEILTKRSEFFDALELWNNERRRLEGWNN